MFYDILIFFIEINLDFKTHFRMKSDILKAFWKTGLKYSLF